MDKLSSDNENINPYNKEIISIELQESKIMSIELQESDSGVLGEL